MPATSEKQRRFFALVNSVQTGERALDSVTQDVARAARSMKPRDTHDFMTLDKAKKHKAKDATEVPVKLALAFQMIKIADLRSSLHRTESAIHQVAAKRRGTLETLTDRLKKENEKLRADSQKMQMSASKTTTDAQAMLAASQQQPQPPPAQTPYGSMLQPQNEEAAQK